MPADKVSFIRYFNSYVTKVSVVPKNDSSFMRSLSGFMELGSKLGFTGIDRKTFMNEYTTTIGKVIYSNSMTVDTDPNTLVIHELCHILQFLRSSMPVEYLFCPSKRMYYESECIQAEIICFPEKRRGDEWMERRVRQFKGYGVKESIVRREINQRMKEVQSNSYLSRPSRVLSAFITWKIMP